MLYKFLVDKREEILALARNKITGTLGNRPTGVESERGLPQYFDCLVREMESQPKGLPKRSEKKPGPHSTAPHGEELSRLGCTMSQVVHGYGALCQAITELAQDTNAPISASEFSRLNLSLDAAIADAARGLAANASVEGVDFAKRMGLLAHELRNALTVAIMAHALVEDGVVGIGSNTNALLGRNLDRMRDILDRTFSELRIHSDKTVARQPLLLIKVDPQTASQASPG